VKQGTSVEISCPNGEIILVVVMGPFVTRLFSRTYVNWQQKLLQPYVQQESEMRSF